MRTVTLGATGLAVTPLAYGTWQFGGGWCPVDEQAAIAAIQHVRSLGIMAAAVPADGPTPEGMS